ncbi:MAG TPA: ABC transporter ATP-binding protein [Candidatus Excrementavichristensenella intestinipullorum]|nr:ABC transporter ATP-binding protein [Candidatus Excrementavichristensenella intestinipullorum]
MALLEVKNLRTTFHIHVGTVQAVRGVDLTVGEGETVGIVGESGCGKSVSMMSILHLLPKNAQIQCDKMVFDGMDLTRATSQQLRHIEGDKIGMIFQDPMTSLNPLFTVGKQLAEPLRIHKGMSKAQARERALELLKTVNMPDPASRLKQYPHELSGGQRQRVMIAMAIACGPKLVIADEPTTALDVTIQAQILDLLGELKEKLNTAVVMITHDLGVIAGMCQRVVVMYAGKVVEEGTVRELFYEPRHPYTWGLLRSIPGAAGAHAKLVPIPGTPPDLIAPPPGCPFAPRCPYAMNICMSGMPGRTALSETHGVCCYLNDEGAPDVEWGGAKG